MDKSYIAGFFDGEGSALIITVRRDPIKNKGVNKLSYQFRPRIMIAQKTTDILFDIKKYLGYGEVVTPPGKSNKYVVQNFNDVLKFIDEISPFTYLKTKQLLILKKMCLLMKNPSQVRKSHKNGHLNPLCRTNVPYLPSEFEQLIDFRDSIFKLNCLTRSGMSQKYPKEVILKETIFEKKTDFTKRRSKNGIAAMIKYQKNRKHAKNKNRVL